MVAPRYRVETGVCAPTRRPTVDTHANVLEVSPQISLTINYCTTCLFFNSVIYYSSSFLYLYLYLFIFLKTYISGATGNNCERLNLCLTTQNPCVNGICFSTGRLYFQSAVIQVWFLVHVFHTASVFATKDLPVRLWVMPGFIFKRNSWLVVSAEEVKIEYFYMKIFNSHIYVLVDQSTMKFLKEIEFANSHILENIVK